MIYKNNKYNIMKKEIRIEKIEEIIKRDEKNPYGKQDIPWKDCLTPMPVFQIPLKYLVFNKYNGRILSRTKSLESQGVQIDAESEKGEKLLEKLLWESNVVRNKQTLDSIKKLGQEKIGIITRDGIIIDGNRRTMLLRRSDKYDYFKTVVLDVTLEENPLEIEKLETSFQLGEDEKLGYEAVEKYLKATGLKERGVPESDIADWMGESVSKIQEYLSVMDTMEDYLDYLGYKGIYFMLDNREDHFINLTKWLEGFYGEKSSKGFDGYQDSDVDDLKQISFDYIRAIYEGKEFRNIATGLKESHFFGNKKIWTSFRDFHFKHVDPILKSEGKINIDSDNLEAYLNDRDARFLEKTKNKEGESFLEENMMTHKQQLENRKSANEPLKLVNSVMDSLDAINLKNPAFLVAEVTEKIEAINVKTTEMLRGDSSVGVFSQVIHLLKSADLEGDKNFKKSILVKIKEIEGVIHKIKKGLR